MRGLRLIRPVGLGLAVLMAVGLFLTSGDYPPDSNARKAQQPPREFRLTAVAPQSLAHRTVILMLFDGLAPALVTSSHMPVIDRLRREGSWSHNLVPPFPTISLVSGFTISTGCWPEHHGIVANRFFDPERGFYDHGRDADWLTGCEHLHEVAERQGVTTATLDWYGEVSSTRGPLAHIVRHSPKWEDQPSDVDRAEQIAQLLIARIVNVQYLLHANGIRGRMVATGTTALVYLEDRTTRDEAVEKLTGREEFAVILPEHQPEWSHLGAGPRVGDVILSARPGYVMEDRGMWPRFVRWLAWTGPAVGDARAFLKASHGYPPDTPGVQGVFYAWGNGIRAGHELARIDAIDVHPTVARLLGIAPGRTVDGRAIDEMLTPAPP